jgi:hypothetical protein
VLLGYLFVRAERRAAAPMLPFAIFADPARRAALAAMLLMGGVLAGYQTIGFGPECRAVKDINAERLPHHALRTR